MSESYSYDIIGFLDKWVPSLYLTTTELTNPYNSKQSISYIKYSLYRDYIHTIAESHKYITYYGASGHSQNTCTYKKYNTLGQLKSDSTITIGNTPSEIDVTTYNYQWENDNWYESRHFKNLISDITTRRNGKIISHISNKYSTLYQTGLPVLSQVVETSDGSSQKTLYSCHRYDRKGKPVIVTDADGLTSIYLWGSDRLYPVAEIKNGEPSQVRPVLGYDPEDAPSDPNIQHSISKLRNSLTESLITSYTYVPYKGVTSITDPAGKTTYFGYDSQSRLTHIWDSKGKLINQYSYETFSGKSTGSDSRPIIQSEQ